MVVGHFAKRTKIFENSFYLLNVNMVPKQFGDISQMYNSDSDIALSHS